MGPAPWSADRARSDGSSAALLAAVWVGLIHCDHPAVLQTEKFLLEEQIMLVVCCSMVGRTLQPQGCCWRCKKQSPSVRLFYDRSFASSTGALPTVFHQRRGALGDGDDALSAAIFALLVLDEIQVEKARSVVEGSDMLVIYPHPMVI